MGGLVCEMLFAPRLHSRWENQAPTVVRPSSAVAIKMIVNTMTARRILAVVARTPEMQTPTEIEPASDAAADCAMRC